MTKRVLSACILAVSTLFSCSEHEFETVVAEEKVVTICLDPGTLATTRAKSYGEDKFNENVIKNVKLFFYKYGKNKTSEATYVYPEKGYLQVTGNEAAVEDEADGTPPTTGKVTVKLTVDDLWNIFDNEGSSNCWVYALVNIKDVVSEDEFKKSTSLDSLKKISIKADFGPDASGNAVSQDSFVMDGEAELPWDYSGNFNFNCTVPISRAASKITLNVTKIDKVDNWEPLPDQMKVAYMNGINAGYVNGTMDKASRQGNDNEYLYKSAAQALTGDAATGWTHEIPFYSYYNLWRDPDNSSNPDCGEAPYLLLSLPWKNDADRHFTCWYAVPFNTLEGHLDRNTWYKINLSVNILGSGDPDKPTVLTPSYMILPWGNEVETNANLMRYRYLMVDQNYYEMHNVNSLTIPFISSHEVEVVDHSLTYTKLKPTKGDYKPEENVPVDASNNPYSVNINKDNNALVFEHTLINDYNSDYDVSAYTLKVTIRHKDDTNYYETLTVVQYPALYVRAELNSDCHPDHIDSGTNGSGGWPFNRWSNNDNAGYVHVNGNNSRNSDWNTVSTYNAGNTDPYMYVVNVSSLPVDADYSIGDPRVDSYNSSFYSDWKNKMWLYGTNHSLTYYYSGEETERVLNMIAPSFRIASSYGVVGLLTYDESKRRCAGYQEDGYPAGRWRLPTPAEIRYMAMLAGDGKIPVLLSLRDSDGYTYYWAADSKAYSPDGPNPGNTSSSGSSNPTYYNYVRCVYDEWYWTDKCDKTTFTWGDKQRKQ